MTERKVGPEEHYRFDFLTKPGEVFEVGNAVFGDPTTGKVVVGQVAAGLVFLGHARQNITGSGSNTVSVELSRKPVRLYAFDKQGTITATDTFKPLYIYSGSAVTLTATGASKIGILWGFNDYGQALNAVGF